MPGCGARISDDDAHDVRRGVELARLLPGGVGEELDQVFIGRAEEVGELEVLVPQRDLLEVLDEVREGVVVKGALADLAVEVDALEHVLQRSTFASSMASSALFKRGADVGLEMANVLDQRASGGDEEGVFVGIGELGLDDLRLHATRLEFLGQLFLLLVEEVAQTLQEEHAKDVFLVGGGVPFDQSPLAGLNVAGFELPGTLISLPAPDRPLTLPRGAKGYSSIVVENSIALFIRDDSRRHSLIDRGFTDNNQRCQPRPESSER